MNRRALLFYTALLSVSLALGCTKAKPAVDIPAPIVGQEPAYVLIVVLDLSGSYAQYIQDGKAWAAVQSTIRRFYRQRLGDYDKETPDKLVIGQISATTVAPLFSGSPRSFAKECQSAGSFRDLVMKHADSRGSRVHESIADTLTYGMGFSTDKNTTFLCVLSDMEDNFPNSQETEEKLVTLLGEFGKRPRCYAGFYWVSLSETPKWMNNLKRCGFPQSRFTIASSIEADPPLPRFEAD